MKYGGYSGNVFSENSITAAIEKGSQLYDPNKPKAAINPFAKKVMAIDPGWGSSACGFCICQLINVSTTTDPITNKTTITKTYTDSYFGTVVQVLYAEEFNRPDFNAMIDVVRNLMHLYGIIADTEAKVYVDGSVSAFIRALKIAIGEDPNYEDVIERSKHAGFRSPDHWLGKVVPIMFGANKEHKSMLGHTKKLLDKHHIAIHPSFTKLVTAIRTAYENDGTLDKERTAHSDVFDSFRMCLNDLPVIPHTLQNNLKLGMSQYILEYKMKHRGRTHLGIITYGLYLYFNSRSYRFASKSLEPFKKRTHMLLFGNGFRSMHLFKTDSQSEEKYD